MSEDKVSDFQVQNVKLLLKINYLIKGKLSAMVVKTYGFTLVQCTIVD